MLLMYFVFECIRKPFFYIYFYVIKNEKLKFKINFNELIKELKCCFVFFFFFNFHNNKVLL